MFVKDFLLRAVKSCQFSALAVSLLSINRLLPVLAGLVQSLIIFCPGLFCLVSYSSCPILSASEAIPHNAAGLISLKYSSDGAILRLRQISVTFPPWPIKLREHSLSPVQSSLPPPNCVFPIVYTFMHMVVQQDWVSLFLDLLLLDLCLECSFWSSSMATLLILWVACKTPSQGLGRWLAGRREALSVTPQYLHKEKEIKPKSKPNQTAAATATTTN